MKQAVFSLCLASLFVATGNAFAGPNIQQWTAPTGARVQFVEIHDLPMLDVQIDFPAGSAYDPPAKSGVASFTNSLLDAGAGELDEQAIADKSADLGLVLGGSTSEDRASLSLRTLSSAAERDAAVELAATVLTHPRFPLEVLERERNRARAGLKESLTKPATLAARAFNAAIYGSHPYGANVDDASLTTLTRDDLIAFHARHYGANTALVTLVGDIDRETAEHIALTLTFGLPTDAPTPGPLPKPALPEPQENHIANPSAQAHILVGLPGMSRDDPDYFPLLVGNYVLGGGGFVSRLTHEVREKRGLAYSVYSYFEPRQVAGPFTIGLQTKGSQSKLALQLVRDNLASFIHDGPSADELQAAKDNLINGFGLRLDANRKILDYVAIIGFYGLPADWLERYPREVDAVSREAIRDAFARRVLPEHLVTIIAGGDGDTSPPPAPANEAAASEETQTPADDSTPSPVVESSPVIKPEAETAPAQ
ncbi:peptidase M16 [Betaproteobacteria bacterium]|nr:peptidase M16 [Betaproteobacteria bacterium]GHT99652.1 peptidase M16 [Betaproteobacteria bacterium]GHU22912.1 peptidase M16 [Betaproteobacteria bacterium]